MWFRALLQHQSDIVTVVGFDGMVHYISPNCERLLGFRADELIGKSGVDNIHPDDIDALVEGLGAQLNDGLDARPFQYRQRCNDGTWVWLEATGRQLPTELGVEAVIVNARDVSERRRADAAAREAESRFRNAFATSPLGIVFADLDGRFTWVNDALAQLLGEPESRLLEMSFADLSTDADVERGAARHAAPAPRRDRVVHLGAALRTRGRLGVDAAALLAGARRRRRADADAVPGRGHHRAQAPRAGPHPRRAARSRSRDCSTAPGLREHVDLAWTSRTEDAPVAVLFGDLDGFKHVNDTLGHDAGDEVLAHVAQRLRTAVRAGDVVARWGGDEFVVLCPTVADVADATAIADRIRVAVEAPFRVGPGRAEIGISVGVALDTGQPLPDLLIKDADAAAYRAKVLGRNRVVVA